MNGKPFANKPSYHAGKPGGSDGKSRNSHSAMDMPVEATSPYNFVPLAEKVFLPDWAENISHDLPFKDGINGELVCDLTTTSPVFVRNSGAWKDHDALMKEEDAWSFFYVKQGDDRQFLLPGTTIKGMLRNVIEIASFGKFSRVDNHRYSVRDLNNKDKKLYMDWMTKTVGQRTYESRIRAGWLTLNDAEKKKWVLNPCNMSRVEHNALVNYHGQHPDIKSKQSGPDKYKNWGQKSLKLKFDPGPYTDHPNHSCGTLRYSNAENLGKGSVEGVIVFTGQPGPNLRPDKKGSKHFEFIFHNASDKRIEIDEAVRKDFVFNHCDVNYNPNEEWKFWKNKLNSGPIPIFYRMTEDGTAIHSMGLAMMYRLPYKHRIHDAIAHSCKEHFRTEKPDLSETIFGTVTDGSKKGIESLKGRASICPAIADLASCRPWTDERYIQTILGGPKPTFYPNYIEQPAQVNADKGTFYKTYMNDDCRVRGWKRYPVRKPETVTRQSLPAGVSNDVDTRMIPLAPKAKFRFRIKIHNLLPVEVGAIIWAITWGGRPHLRHSIGMGKPFGFGQAVVSIDTATSSLTTMQGGVLSADNALAAFTDQMKAFAGKEWEQSKQIEQLLAMADPSTAPHTDKLKYPLLTVKPNRNDFASIKRQGRVLASHVPVGSYRSRIAQGVVASLSASGISSASAPGDVGLVWPDAFLVYNPGGGGVVTAQTEGMTATFVLTPEGEKMFPADILEKLKGKKRTARATVTVESIGGKRFRIIKVKNV